MRKNQCNLTGFPSVWSLFCHCQIFFETCPVSLVCPFWGLKTRPDQTFKHYLKRCSAKEREENLCTMLGFCRVCTIDFLWIQSHLPELYIEILDVKHSMAGVISMLPQCASQQWSFTLAHWQNQCGHRQVWQSLLTNIFNGAVVENPNLFHCYAENKVQKAFLSCTHCLWCKYATNVGKRKHCQVL